MKRSYTLKKTSLSLSNQLRRLLWMLCWSTLYRYSPTPLHIWRRFLLRIFGSRVEKGAHPYPRARIWAPWNLKMGAYSCLANDVDCYSVAQITLGAHATVSQYSYLCTASHDFRDPTMPMISAPIEIENDAWVAADVFVGPGVRIGQGAVIAARSTVIADIEPWKFAAGSPAIIRSERPSFTR